MPATALPLLLAATLATGPAATGTTDARCAVWQRELAFAHAVGAHDARAIARFAAPGAVFDANTTQPVRGRAAIARAWAPLVAGTDLALRWYPDQVVLSPDAPDFAYSSGPYLLEPRGRRAGEAKTTGRFASLWHRGGDGVWRVLFDGGDAGHVADAKAVAKFIAGRRVRCPGGHGEATPGR